MKKNSAVEPTLVVATNPFRVDEVIWGKIRGAHHWPAKVLSFKDRRIFVEWFNDYRTTGLFRSQIYKFGPNFPIFTEKLDDVVGLRGAVEEALRYGMENNRKK